MWHGSLALMCLSSLVLSTFALGGKTQKTVILYQVILKIFQILLPVIHRVLSCLQQMVETLCRTYDLFIIAKSEDDAAQIWFPHYCR